MTQFCEVAVPVPLDKLFFYSVPPSLEIKPGMRVIVPFGTRKLVGVVLRCGVQPADIERKLIKPIQATMDEEPALSNELLRLGAWMAGYYQVPVGEALAALLPRNPAVRKTTKAVLTAKGERALHISLQQKSFSKKASTDELALLNRLARRKGIRQESLRDSAPMLRKLERRGWIGWERTLQARSDPGLQAGTGGEVLPEWGKGHELTRQQREALTRVQQAMETGKFSVLLLQGVTGSGKTEVYLRAMETALRRNRPVLMLVPEINLTPAMAGLFTSRFGSRVALLHSGLGEGERAAQWQRVRAGHSDVVLGTRSAVMVPLDRPGLVIVDEEQDSSYKQDEAPRYNGRDVAILRAREAGATVILGSATPALETRYNAEQGKYRLLELEQRVLERPLPETAVVDMREEFAETGKAGFLSRRLQEEIAKRLEQKEQSLILLNRRGYSAFVLCRSCGEAVQCNNCSIVLTHHRRIGRLLCHYCGFARPVPRKCPGCSSEHIYFVGEGSERIEETLHEHFPQARIGRLDRDTARGRGQGEAILSAFRNHELDILVGTQMIAKGHDIHRVTLVGVISADIGLARPDFRAAERTFQLLTQVAGRAGRGDLPGEVIIQTYYPDHYAIRAAAAQDYDQFYRQELRYRKLLHYPPFSVLANLVVKSPSAETALKLTGRLGRHLEGAQKSGVRLLGPASAPIFRLKKDYRYQFLIKAARRNTLREILVSCREFARRENFPAAALIIDVDPQSLS